MDSRSKLDWFLKNKHMEDLNNSNQIKMFMMRTIENDTSKFSGQKNTSTIENGNISTSSAVHDRSKNYTFFFPDDIYESSQKSHDQGTCTFMRKEDFAK